MRSKLAVALAVLGLVLLGLGIGQRTLWLPPESVTATLPAGSQAGPVTVLTPAMHAGHSGPISLKIKSSGPILLATGRDDDVNAWVAQAAHLTVTGADADFKSLASTFKAGDASVPNPSGSDLWTTEQSGTGELNYTWQGTDSDHTSLLLAGDGTAKAPTEISATVANDTATPWAVPLIVVGILLLLCGLGLFFFRPRPGSGRRGMRAPAGRTKPQSTETGAAAPREAAPGEKAPREAAPRVRTALATGAAVVVTAVLAATGMQAAQADTAAPSASPSAPGAAAPAAPVVNDAQFSRIVDAVSKAAAAADAAKDAKELTGRFDGSALALRTGNYKVRSQVADYQAVPPVTSSKLLTKAVSTNRSWPRSFTAVTQGPDNPVPQILTMVQNTPRENYKLVSATGLLPGQTLPLADKNGAAAIGVDDKSGLQYSPKEALAAVADRLNSGNSSWKGKIPDNAYITDTLAYQDKAVADSPQANLVFSHQVVDGSVHTYRAADGGALVMANFAFNAAATPKEDGATLSFQNDAAVFAGGKDTKTGYTLNFTEPVVIYIPADKATTQLSLLAATRGLTGAAFK